MNLIILPGNSQEHNEQWLEDSAANFADLFDDVETIYYNHWNGKEGMIDLDAEVEKLAETANSLEGDYVIYAKSAGTWVTLQAVAEEKIRPTKCIFVGSPLKGRSFKFASGKHYDIPTMFIQQTDDMFFKYAELEKFLDNSPLESFVLVEIPGHNHAYDNYDEIKEKMNLFLHPQVD